MQEKFIEPFFNENIYMFVIQYMCWGQKSIKDDARDRRSSVAEKKAHANFRPKQADVSMRKTILTLNRIYGGDLSSFGRHSSPSRQCFSSSNVSQSFVPRHFYIKKEDKNGIHKCVKNLIRKKVIFDMRCGEIKSIKIQIPLIFDLHLRKLFLSWAFEVPKVSLIQSHRQEKKRKIT